MNLFIKDEYGHIMTITPEELKEKLGITFDIVALGVEVNDGETTIKAQSYKMKAGKAHGFNRGMIGRQ